MYSQRIFGMRTMAMTGKEKRAKRRAAGICQRCPNKTLNNRVHCPTCEETQRSRHASRHKALRQQVIAHYGGACRCGQSVYGFLTIEYKHGGGVKHRREVGPARLPQWVIENNYPDTIEILCWNCNCSKNKSKLHSNNPNAVARRRFAAKARHEAITAYGGACACCGTTKEEYLTIDHTNGGGTKHRKTIGATTATLFFRWLKAQGWPTGFRVLCFNCNGARGAHGRCPHQGV